MKNIKKLRLSNWINYTIRISPSIFSKELIKTNLNKFWINVIEKELKDDQHIIFLFRIQWTDNQFVSIGNLQKLNKEDKDYVLNKIVDNMIDKGGYYLEQSILSLVFTYAIRKGKALEKVINTNVQFHNYQLHNLPITMDPLKYGKLIEKFGDSYILQVTPKNIATITQLENSNKVKFYKSGELSYVYTDKWIDSNTFSRILGKKEWIFKNNKEILFKSEKLTKFIQPLVRSDTVLNKFITMDIETFIKDGIHIPYCISWFDGENSFSYYLTNFKDHDCMIIQAIKDIMVKKYDNYKVYIHNLARFDGIFLLRILAKLGYVKPIIHNDKLISIGFKFKDYDITFRDSLQLLTKSLRDLGKSFGVDTQKSIFPYTFVNENNLNYISHVPEFKYFSHISKLEYQEYCAQFENKTWNLESETEKYCEIDCISLFRIIFKFNELIFERFQINIHKYSTLSALAFVIYRSSFMTNNEIPQLSGQVAKDIRLSYTGGAVDMYIPENLEGEEVFAYDVNALYPSQMKELDMPVGVPILFEGDIRNIDPNAFGFFYCKIKAPKELEHPIIQTHIKVNNVTSTIAPLGQWEDIIFSAEMDNAMKFGYEFEILWGYIFERKNIFKDYVDTLYQLRSQYPRSHPLNYIAKLLMNSLYGKFGMNDSFPIIEILTKKEFNKFIDDFNGEINNYVELDDKFMVIYRNPQANVNTMLDGNKESHNVSIPIASAITAYARIHMSQFKNNQDFKLYYSDTDSVYINKPLLDHLVDNKTLGKMKLENIITKAIFLAPKMYYLETENNKTIYKVKGLSHDIELTRNDFENLLFKESTLEKIQTKWRKFLNKGHIEVIDQMYTLKVTENKRKLIYDENGKLVGTLPFKIDKSKTILNK